MGIVNLQHRKNRMNYFIRFAGDPCENRTRVTAVKGPCLNLLTNGPYDRGKNATAQYIKGNHQDFYHEKPSDTCQTKEKTG